LPAIHKRVDGSGTNKLTVGAPRPPTITIDKELIMPMTTPEQNKTLVMAHGRFSGIGRPAPWVAADVARFEDGLLTEPGICFRTRPHKWSPSARMKAQREGDEGRDPQ
jgi:hypothetical protein